MNKNSANNTKNKKQQIMKLNIYELTKVEKV